MSQFLSISFADCREYARKIPFVSTPEVAFLVFDYLNGDGSKTVVWYETSGDQKSFKTDFSKEAIHATLARTVMVMVLPLFAQSLAYLNFGAAAVRFAFGVFSSMKGHSVEEIKKEFEASLTHLAIGVNDYAFGYLLGMRHIGTVASVIIGLIPLNVIQSAYGSLYRKMSQEDDEPLNHHELDDCGFKSFAQKAAVHFLPERTQNIARRVSQLFGSS